MTNEQQIAKIEADIKAAVDIIINSEPGSPAAIRAGYDVVTLRHMIKKLQG